MHRPQLTPGSNSVCTWGKKAMGARQIWSGVRSAGVSNYFGKAFVVMTPFFRS